MADKSAVNSAASDCQSKFCIERESQQGERRALACFAMNLLGANPAPENDSVKSLPWCAGAKSAGGVTDEPDAKRGVQTSCALRVNECSRWQWIGETYVEIKLGFTGMRAACGATQPVHGSSVIVPDTEGKKARTWRRVSAGCIQLRSRWRTSNANVSPSGQGAMTPKSIAPSAAARTFR